MKILHLMLAFSLITSLAPIQAEYTDALSAAHNDTPPKSHDYLAKLSKEQAQIVEEDIAAYEKIKLFTKTMEQEQLTFREYLQKYNPDIVHNPDRLILEFGPEHTKLAHSCIRFLKWEIDPIPSAAAFIRSYKGSYIVSQSNWLSTAWLLDRPSLKGISLSALETLYSMESDHAWVLATARSRGKTNVQPITATTAS